MNLCACMGPQRGDPYCYCEMIRKGLTPTPWSAQEEADLKAAFAKMFGWDTTNAQEVKRDV